MNREARKEHKVLDLFLRPLPLGGKNIEGCFKGARFSMSYWTTLQQLPLDHFQPK